MFSPKYSFVSLVVSSVLCYLPMCSGQAIVWDQQPDTSLTTVIDSEFAEPQSGFSTYLLNDVTVGSDVIISEVTTYFSNNSFTWPANISEARLCIFSEDFTPFDPRFDGELVPVTVTDLGGGVLAVTTASKFRIGLNAGVHWIGLSPVVDTGVSQEFRFDSGNTVGAESVARNPSGVFGLGTDWFPASTLAQGFGDAAMTIFGTNLADTVFAFPDSATVVRGFQASGQFDEVCSSDDERWVLNPGFTLNSEEAPVWIEFEGRGRVNGLPVSFTIESQAGTPGLTLTIEEFNFSANSYDVVGVERESFNVDVQRAIPLIGFESSDRDIRIRVGWRQTGFTINFPWEVRIDSVVWDRF